MLAVVEAGMRVGELRRVLAEGGQEWPVDAPDDATVGGVIAAGVVLAPAAAGGHVRDTVVELELVTGDGRLVRSGARTVKNVTGYDLHRLATGSLGTLGVIVQVALKVRPLPQARRMLTSTAGGLEPGRTLLEAVPLPSAVLPTPDRVEVGWRDGPTRSRSRRRRRAASGTSRLDEERRSAARPARPAPIVAEVAVAPVAARRRGRRARTTGAR